jgi:flagellar motor switch protein FliN
MVDESQNPSAEGAEPSRDLDRILEIPLEITVELGRRRMRISELLAIGTGGILELATLAGAPLSIYANQTLIAQGEAVVIGEKYGVRVTDIVSPRERVKRLGGVEGDQ